eukprot:Nitzschia sp. Nitz4//scaffold312_size24368//18987//20291//NITZ4_008368-RA/size24368-processed-gene-0.5-mRNA-1//-1//CDS//3329547405//8509//frame0
MFCMVQLVQFTSITSQHCTSVIGAVVVSQPLEEPTSSHTEVVSINYNQSLPTGVPAAHDLYLPFQALWNAWIFAPTFTGQRSKPLILKHLFRRSSLIHPNDIVLATHISVHKVQALSIFLKYWSGPSSIAVHITSQQDIREFFAYLLDAPQDNPNLRDVLNQATFHFVLEKPPNQEAEVEEGSWGYPHNILRNIALESIETDFAALFDVDFIPSPLCYTELNELFRLHPKIMESMRANRTLLVLPAFELFPCVGELFASEDLLPQSKNEVLQKVRQNQMVPFRKSYPVCQNLTDFAKWLTIDMNGTGPASHTYPIALTGQVERRQFEPYVVGYRPGMHRYWEDFRGFGYNKHTFFMESQVTGYSFAVLNDFFCTHLNHPEVPVEEQKARLSTNLFYYKDFVRYLVQRYGMETWYPQIQRKKWWKILGKWPRRIY